MTTKHNQTLLYRGGHGLMLKQGSTSFSFVGMYLIFTLGLTPWLLNTEPVPRPCVLPHG